jgi:uncharacterized protein (DUF2147 family)
MSLSKAYLEMVKGILFIGLIFPALTYADSDQSLLTKWKNEAGTGFIQIKIAEDGTLEGLGAEGGDKDRKDANNPDPALREKPLLGARILWGFKPDNASRTKWSGGKIYDPDNGKTYSCKLELDGSELKITGFVGISLFGRTTIWKKAEVDASIK